MVATPCAGACSPGCWLALATCRSATLSIDEPREFAPVLLGRPAFFLEHERGGSELELRRQFLSRFAARVGLLIERLRHGGRAAPLGERAHYYNMLIGPETDAH